MRVHRLTATHPSDALADGRGSIPYKDPEAARAAKHAYYLAHREESLARSAAYAKEHPEQIKATRKKFKQNHKDKIRAEARSHRQAHPEQYRAYQRLKYASDTERFKVYQTRNRQKRRDKNLAYNKDYYQTNTETIKQRHQSPAYRAARSAHMARRRAENPEHFRARQRQYYDANPHKYAEHCKRHRARPYGVENRLTHEQWLLMWTAGWPKGMLYSRVMG